MTPHPCNLSLTPHAEFPSSIVVGNGSTLPVHGLDNNTLPGPVYLYNILLAPAIIKNLLSMRHFTNDNWVSVEFDLFGFFVKDLRTRIPLLRCNSPDPLFTWQLPAPASPPCSLYSVSPTLWHQRLSHPGQGAPTRLASSSSIECNKATGSQLYHAC